MKKTRAVVNPLGALMLRAETEIKAREELKAKPVTITSPVSRGRSQPGLN